MKLPNTVRIGAKGESVKYIQRRLNQHGAAPALRIDGVFGKLTLAEVKKFQRKNGLVIDGIVGVQTQSFLKQNKNVTPSTKKAIVTIKPKPVVKGGGIGERLACQLESWAGLVEQPAGTNVVPKLSQLGKRVKWSKGIYSMGFAWCGYAVHLALAMLDYKPLKASGTWTGYTGMYVPNTVRELQKIGAKKIDKKDIKRGDILIFWQGTHIGVATGKAKADGSIPTIEGNTSRNAAGSQSNGGGVFKRNRKKTDITTAWRLP